MSGSGGGGNSGSPRSTKSLESLDCNNLIFEAFLSSPDPSVLKRIALNDVLEISQTKTSIVAITNKGDIAGSIISNLSELKKCLSDDFEYIGLVIELDSAKCKIQIRPQSK